MRNNATLIKYSNCWEDTENILRTLDEGKTILSVCSGGDNTIAMLLNNPKKIVAFDRNIYQLYLLKLKICGFKNLNYEELLVLLGINKGEAYKLFEKIKNKLDDDTATFFEDNKYFFEDGIINIGKFERYFQLFKKYICPLYTSKKKLYEFMNLESIDEQKNFYTKKINNKRFKSIFRIFFGFRVMGKFGRDKSCYNYVEEKKQNAKDIKERFDRGITTIINKTNPYVNYILLNKFSDECMPTYLQKDNYEKIKRDIDKIEILHGSLLDVEGKFDYLNLSDIFEYMSDEEFEENVNHIVKISNDEAKIIYYNMQNKRYIKNESFSLQKDLSEDCYKKTKSYFYRDFLLYIKEK